MKRSIAKITSSLISLSYLWSAGIYQEVFSQNPQNTQTTQNPQTTVQTPFQFSADKAQLDLDVTPSAEKAAPFTLGVKRDFIPEATQNNNLNGQAGADGGFRGSMATPSLDGSTDGNRFALQIARDMHLLAKFDLHILVDRSKSMGQRDCPDALSRWQWCGQQASSLAQTFNQVAPQGLTLITFATQYDVFANARASDIEYLFQNMQLQFGTRLFEPMAEQFDTYFADKSPNKKPLLVVVVTDGIPAPKFEMEYVRNELVATTNRMKTAHDVTVIFCQIGGQDPQGQNYLQDLDQNLTSYGAKYDIVHTVSFDQMQQVGLGGALANTIQKFMPVATAQANPSSSKPVVKSSVKATISQAKLEANRFDDLKKISRQARSEK